MSKFVRTRDLAGYRPAPEALAAAPLLQRWHLVDERSGDGAALFGVRARDRARVETDCVVAVDVREGWAHCNGGGLWRLDAPADLKRVRHHSLLCWRTETAERADAIGFGLPPRQVREPEPALPAGPRRGDRLLAPGAPAERALGHAHGARWALLRTRPGPAAT